jgi:hypothetical protein
MVPYYYFVIIAFEAYNSGSEWERERKRKASWNANDAQLGQCLKHEEKRKMRK